MQWVRFAMRQASVVMALVLSFMASGAVSAQKLGALLDNGPYYGLQGDMVRLLIGPVSGGDGVDPAVGDWNGDGRPDLLLGSRYGDLTLFVTGVDGLAGAPQAVIPSPLTLNGWPPQVKQASPELADWDGDGNPDLLLGLGNSLFLYTRHGQGVSEGQALVGANGQPLAKQFPADSGHLAPCADDLDGDGDLDLLLADDVGRVWWVQNDGSAGKPALATPQQISAGGRALVVAGPARVSVGNVSGDTRKDLVIGDGNGGLWVCEGTASGFLAPRLVMQFHGPVSPHVCLRDGKTVVLVGLDTGLVQVVEPDGGAFRDAGSLEGRNQLLDVGGGAMPVATDWDADGDSDLIVGADDGRILYFEHTSDGYIAGRPLADQFGQPIKVPGPAWPCIADLDGDGDTDLLVGSGDGRVHLWLNNNGSFMEAGVLRVAGKELIMTGPAAISVADYDGDGDMDCFVASVPPDAGQANLPDYRVVYLENSARRLPSQPVFSKAVPLNVFVSVLGADTLLDGTALGLRFVQISRSAPNGTDFIAVSSVGVLAMKSAASRLEYPQLVADGNNAQVSPLIPPVYSATLATMAGKAGILCGLQPYGMVCFYPNAGL